ncbi:MAG: hypothetical protein A4E33_01530 [Methanoregula sp. PtaB.Bin085]|nr:MAG: hypothetical protein A4E33_01530 [Methanoregula sp. PtaB.Bin085]
MKKNRILVIPVSSCAGPRSSSAPQRMLPVPAAAMPAPVRPPTSECVDDAGRPILPVRMFQIVAVTIAAKMMTSSCGPDPTLTRPTSVKATALPPRSTPKKDMAATSSMPLFGVADREAMNVAAIELASWKPFVNVNANASRMVRMASPSMVVPRRYLSDPRNCRRARMCCLGRSG